MKKYGYIHLTCEMIKLNIISAMEYRTSFLTQVIGMIVNDIGIIVVWVIFFQSFPELNGWTFKDTATMFSIAAISAGIVSSASYGIYELAKMISQGEIDYFFSFPKNILWHISVSRTMIGGIGDVIFGFFAYLIIVTPNLQQLCTFLAISALVTLFTYNFIVIVQSLAFFFGSFEKAADELYFSLLGFALYPQNSFKGILKILTMTLLPAFFIYTLPASLLQNINPQVILILGLFGIATSIGAYALFNAGLKRYESGNLINVRA
jgi:ABC-2 type transport system permease protein